MKELHELLMEAADRLDDIGEWAHHSFSIKSEWNKDEGERYEDLPAKLRAAAAALEREHTREPSWMTPEAKQAAAESVSELVQKAPKLRLHTGKPSDER